VKYTIDAEAVAVPGSALPAAQAKAVSAKE
jgi:hypothetical protein